MSLDEISKKIKQISDILYSYPNFERNNKNSIPNIFNGKGQYKNINWYYIDKVKSFLYRKW